MADESADILTAVIFAWLRNINSFAQTYLGPFPWKKLGGPTYGFHLNSEKTGGARAPPAP